MSLAPRLALSLLIAAAVASPAVAAPTPTAPASPPAQPVAGDAVDFTADATLLYRVAACGGDGPVGELLAPGDAKLAARYQKVVDRHCKAIRHSMDEFRAAYLTPGKRGRQFFDELVPAGLPTTVLYGFGGGDLLSALVAFPFATEITTTSLELAGDPRRLKTLTPDQLEGSLGALRVEIGGLLQVGSNTSENLSKGQKNELPGQVSSFLMGLVTAGYEPVKVRYFSLDPQGAVHYLTRTELDEADAKNKAAKSRKGDWVSPNFSEAFAHVEIQYRKVGSTDGKLFVHRHIGWNLNNEYLGKHGELLAHLAAKGKVTILVKGASYLLWHDTFTTFRKYLIDHLAWMLSDSTGIPADVAAASGFVQEPYGSFSGAFLEGDRDTHHDAAMVALFQKRPKRRLPVRFGYFDKDKQVHVIVTRPK